MPERGGVSKVGSPPGGRAKASQEGDTVSALDGLGWYMTAAGIFFALFSSMVFLERGVEVNRFSLEVVIVLAFFWPATLALSLLLACARVVVEARR